MQEFLGMGVSKHHNPDSEKRKMTLTDWGKFKTVSWRADAQRDYTEHTSVVLAQENKFSAYMMEFWTWGVPAVVGILTATSGSFIEKCVEFYGMSRFGYCKNPFVFVAGKENCLEWQDWAPMLSNQGYGTFIAISTFIAAVSATLTWAFAPMSRGSGIPEVKTILGGFVFPDALSGRTLVIKIIGLAMSVGSGLACGKEGPLVHISCCWCSFICKFFPRYKDNEAKQRELLSCACASGVAVAFGAPLGGVLFSLEEASTIFPMRTMLRAFCGATVAAMTLAYQDPTGSGKLTMFNCPYDQPPRFTEYPIFILMGILGGWIGAIFVHYNIKICVGRAPGTPFRAKCHIVLEVAALSFFTAITSYHLLQLRVLSNAAIRAFFHNCADPAVQSPIKQEEFMLNICDPDVPGKPRLDLDLMYILLAVGVLRHIQMSFTFGTGAASGLFIPSLYVGAALGRIVGMAVYSANETAHFAPKSDNGPFVNGVHPGIYAMLGAAAVLGGVCRVTISLVVIMFELTGGLQLIVPFMIVCMIAKWVGDMYTPGIYDYAIQVRKYPFLHEPDEVTFSTNANDVMDESIDCLHPDCAGVGQLIECMKAARYGGYPLTVSKTDPSLLGYIHTDQFLQFLVQERETNTFVTNDTRVVFKKYLDKKDPQVGASNALDASKQVDEGVMVVVPNTPASQLQQIFRNLGVRIILVRDRAALVGMITKKSFIKHMEELHHSDHCASKTEGGLKEALLPK
jgi:chloride channel 3/4/5